MNDIRAKFEEIWPVPEGVYWHETACDYMTLDGIDDWQDNYFQRVRDSYAARLDTFTRCQETTDVYVSLVDELVAALENTERALAGMLFAFDDGVGREWSEDLLDYARKLVSAKEYVK